MLENVERCGGVPVVVEDAWGTPADPNKLEDAFKANPDAKPWPPLSTPKPPPAPGAM
jgi:aspartate aminotransferase-like enzyme